MLKRSIMISILFLVFLLTLLSGCGKKSGEVCNLTLVINDSRGGGVQTSSGLCTMTCDYYMDRGTVFAMTALSSKGWRFVEWQGSISGTSPNVILTVNGNLLIKAIFTRTTGEGASEESISEVYPECSILSEDICVLATENRLEAKSISSGDMLWEYEAGSLITRGPVLDEAGVIHIGIETVLLIGLDAKTGSEISAQDITDIE
jgi:hypothetical protein